MKMNKHLNVKHLLWLCFAFLVLQFSITSCKDVIADGDTTFYTFTGEMVTDYLQNRNEKFSDFIEVLQRAEIYDLLSTYGTYTCFAPTNTAMNSYLQSRGLTSVSQLARSECDTLAFSHLIKVTYFTTDMNDGVISTTNMNDRYLSLTCDTDAQKNVKYFINMNSQIITRDDSVENGVVHTIDRVLTSSNDLLPTILEKDTTITLFCQAMKLTGLDVLTSKYLDPTYSCSSDSVELGILYHTGNEWETGFFMKARKFMYTAFVETDSVFAQKQNIRTIAELKAYAKSVYDLTYPKDAGLYDQDWTNRKNPLNRFIAYHFLDRLGNYNELTISGEVKRLMQVKNMDATDTYETLCPHTVVQVSSPSEGLFLNRKGVGANFTVRGVKIGAPSDSKKGQNALNGVYHYIDDILTYSTQTKDIVFNCRFRFDATTLSSDFMSSGARGRAGTATCTAFKGGSVKDWSFSDKTFVSVRNRHTDFDSYQGDEVVLLGQYDFTFKLPPVPEGTYEIRLGYCAMSTRGVIQTIFKRRSNGSWIKPFSTCGIPLDLRVNALNNAIGWIADATNTETNKATDKAMHNRGYMKGPDSIMKNGSPSFRNSAATFRCILTTRYLSADEDNYLHIRQVLENPKAEFAFDYIELCPKSVFDNGEDTH